MTRPLQILAALLAAAVAFATLGPPSARPHLRFLGQNGEHALAFVVLGLAAGVAFSKQPWLTLAIGVTLTALVELAQFLAPGRHARWSDFVVDASSLCAGLAIAALLRPIWQRRENARSRLTL